jgi:Aspartyl protease
MKKFRSQRCFMTCLLLFSLLYVFAGQAVHAGSPVNFRFVRNYLVVIPVRVNGAGPYDFLLDTGTNSTILTPELASRIHLQATDSISLVTLSGIEVLPRAVLDSLTLGTKSIKRLEVIFDDLKRVRAVSSKICGDERIESLPVALIRFGHHPSRENL